VGDIPISTLQSREIKRRLRRSLKARRSAMSQAERQRYSAMITSYVCDLPMYRASETVMLYMALADEVQTTSLIAHARRHHKRVVVPVVTPNGLLAVVCPTEASHFRPGPFGILEPRDLSAVVPLTEIDSVFVPGIGFDAKGVRLGYGGGYYDRFLRLLPAHTHFGGLAFHVQIVPSIPRLSHDICMPFVVTEQGVRTYDTTAAPCENTPASEAG
jgi:5-formyltetrahydrofolate cyclo-ligase